MAVAPETRIVRDAFVSAAAGYVGGTVMEQFNMQSFQRLEPGADREGEQEARPGPPYVVAAKKMAGAVGIELDADKAQQAGMALHYLLPISWVPTYMALRRTTGMRPLMAGLVSGAAMSAIVDEGVTPALGFSAPNREYPLSTHVRAVAAHLLFGVAVATVVEGAWRLLDRG
jgi:hypothetical protein